MTPYPKLTKTINPQPQARIYGLEYLRAIACIFVVAFHASPILMDFWYAKKLHVFVFAAAVPIFILISLFLTELKGANKDYISQKTYRLGKIYLLWAWFIPLLVYLIYKFVANPQDNFMALINNQSIYELIINGPNFPFKVYGVYFLVYLIVLSWFYYILRQQMKTYSQVIRWTIFLGAINLALPFLPESYKIIRESLLAFLIYLPLTKMLYLDYQRKIAWQPKAVKFGVLYVVTAILEAVAISLSEQLPLITYRYSPYGRLSIVFLAVCSIYLAFGMTQKTAAKVKLLKQISRSSLGIYLIHGFIIDYFRNIDHDFLPALFFMIILLVSLSLSALIKNTAYVKQILTL
ncbi:MAG: acyltransferase [Cyanobacteria bacterium J06643_13]